MNSKAIRLLSALLVLSTMCSQAGDDTSACLAKPQKSTQKKPVMPMPPMFDEAVQACKTGKYKEALEKFDKLDRTGWCCDKVHYYMGLCSHNLNQLQAAEKNYLVVYRFSKDPILRYNAQVGYHQVQKYASSRTYSGQGNNFDRLIARGGWGSSGGGGGSSDEGDSGGGGG